MTRKRKINLGGEIVEATEVGFRPSGEHWNEYLLDDGTVVRLKLVVTSVMRLDGRYDPQSGDPIYMVNSQNVMGLSVPDDLRGGSDADNAQ